MADKEKKIAETAPSSAAEKKTKEADKKPAKNAKPKVKLTDRIKKFWLDYKSEFKKIVWPSKEETIKSTVVVVSTVVIFAVSIAILDFVFSQCLTLLSHL
ncbi:MAG: preprotein translocase subunit SecE [Clostridia bacterium]|nr:preprotein translocase subunit SecE [Clostridia bacterium]